MNLNELAVGVMAALLIQSRLRRPGADHGVRRLPEDRSNAAGGGADGVGREGADFHGAQVHGANATTDAVSVEHGGEKLPVLVLLHLAFGLVTADLFVQRIQKLLGVGCTGECRKVVECPPKAAEIE